MATITGYATPAILDVQPVSWPAWTTNNPVPYQDTPEVHLPSNIVAAQASLTNNLPIELIPDTNPGYYAGGYFDEFYNRIWIDPLFINFGNIVNDESYTVKVYNAYFASKTLSAINITNPDGVDISGATPPTVYGPLTEDSYDITVYIDGPPTINSTFEFDWLTPTEDLEVVVVGSRIVTLPYLPRPGAIEELEWKTDILVSNDGSEQRVRTRREPRQQFKYTMYLANAELTRAENRIHYWRDQTWALPVWTEQQLATVTQGDTVINVETRWSDFRVDGQAMIWESPRKYDVFLIDAMTDSTITLGRGVADDFTDGLVVPMRTARLVGNPVRGTDANRGFLSASFLVEDNIELSTSPSATQFLSTDVFLEAPLKGGDFIQDSYIKEIDVVDFKTGLFETFSDWDDTKIGRGLKYLEEGLENVWTFREWLHRRSGRLLPFYMPTFENNLRLVPGQGTLTTVFSIYDDDQEIQGADRVHIAISTTSGWLLRTITDISPGAAGELDVTVDSSLSIDQSDVEFVSYMGLKRLTSDKISFVWNANNVVNFSVPIMEIEP